MRVNIHYIHILYTYECLCLCLCVLGTAMAESPQSSKTTDTAGVCSQISGMTDVVVAILDIYLIEMK